METMDNDNYEKLRLQNLELMKRKFEEQFGKIPEVPDVPEDEESDYEEFKVTEKRKPRKYSYKKLRVSLPPRMSLRSRGECSIDYSEADKLIDELENPGRICNNGKKILVRRSLPVVVFRKVPVHNLKPVNEITDDDLSRICYKTTQRVYDPENGTTCHQCRQKTSDFKSICRNPSCNGVRGQFCGFCLLKRYGEDVAKVVVDEKWSCPPCRNICNCSICRKRLGKPPTGILAPIAESRGYSSVKDFLLEEEKDLYIYEDNDSDKENDFVQTSEPRRSSTPEKQTNDSDKENHFAKTKSSTPEKIADSSNFHGFPTFSPNNELFQKMKILLENRKRIYEHFHDVSSDFHGFSSPKKSENSSISKESFSEFSSDKENDFVKTNEPQKSSTPEKITDSSNFHGFPTFSPDNKLFQKMEILLENRKRISELFHDVSSDFHGFSSPKKSKNSSSNESFSGFSSCEENPKNEKLLSFLKNKLFDTKESDEKSDSFDFVGFSTNDITDSEAKINFFGSQLDKIVYQQFHPDD